MSSKRATEVSINVALHTGPRAPAPVGATLSQGAAWDRAVQTDWLRGNIIFKILHIVLTLVV